MSQAKLEQALYYIGDESELAVAKKLQENLAKGQGKIPLHLGTKGQKIPGELVLLAHSDDTRTYIGEKTPKELAQELAKQFAGQDKTQLKSVKLVACEGGYGEHPLALALAQELYKQGFTNAVVKAVTHPKESRIGGVVSVTTQAGISRMYGNEDGQVQGVMYGNQKTADYIRWKELSRMKPKGRRDKGDWTEESQKEMEHLATKNSDFRGFDEKHSDYCVIKLIGHINDLDAPHNSYTHKGVQARVSLDAAIALDSLRQKRFAYSFAGNKNAVNFIDAVIERINQNPSLDKSGILQIFMDKELTKKVSKSIVSDIKVTLDATIGEKLMAMDPSKRPSKVATIASKIEDDEDYLARLLKKDGFFDKIWRSIYGTDEFTKGLRLLVKRVSSETLLAKADREDIIGQIEAQKEKDVDKCTVTDNGFLGFGKKTTTNTALKTLYDALKLYYDKPNPGAQDWVVLQAAKKEYDDNQSARLKSPVLEGLIKDLEKNNQKFNDIGKGLNDIKAQVNTAIQNYLDKYDKAQETDNTHKPKVAVIKAIKAYVDRPNAASWDKLEQSAQDIPGWDKGCFSKVKYMMSEARKVHEEQQNLESDVSSTPRPKGM